MKKFLKKFKQFISSKGGMAAFISTIILILLGGFLIITGVVYQQFNGDWSKIPQILSSDFAISVYIIIGVTIMFLIIILIYSKRSEEIK